MNRATYIALWTLGMPLVLGRLAWRARRQPDYLAYLPERFGRLTPPGTPCIWLHAVSVGETRAAQPLVKALLTAYPKHCLLITHMTPTGRATGRELFGNEPRIQQAWLPYDLPWLARRFLRTVKPVLGIVMETEVWPNLMALAAHLGIPTLLANARLSERSAKGYARLGKLAHQAFGRFDRIAAQSAADADRLGSLSSTGLQQISVTGNIKYDVQISMELQRLGKAFKAKAGGRRIVLANSTRDGEEALLLEAFCKYATKDVLFVIVPRHPQRFDTVATLVEKAALRMQRRSDDAVIEPTTRVWLGDSMGEMAAYYAMADVSLIGGSWLPFGSQNLIESCAAGVPVMIGPHSFNFAEAAEKAIAAGAALRCENAEAGIQAALSLLDDPVRRKAMSEAGVDFCQQHSGATARLLAIVKALMKPPAAKECG